MKRKSDLKAKIFVIKKQGSWRNPQNNYYWTFSYLIEDQIRANV